MSKWQAVIDTNLTGVFLCGREAAGKFVELKKSDSDHHHHIFCRKCGSITDIELNPELELNLETEVKKIENEYSLSIDSHSLELFGSCNSCTMKSK